MPRRCTRHRPTVNGIEHLRFCQKADESKRKQGVDQQMQLREQLLKTGEVQRQLMKLQSELAGEGNTEEGDGILLI